MAHALQLPASSDAAWRRIPEVIRPKRGSALKGTVLLDAGIRSGGIVNDAKVSFILSGNGERSLVIANGHLSLLGFMPSGTLRWSLTELTVSQ